MQALQCTEEEANTIIKNYEEGFSGTKKFAIEGSKLLRKRGYVLMNPDTGHKMYWWDFDVWKNRQDSFTFNKIKVMKVIEIKNKMYARKAYQLNTDELSYRDWET